MTHRNFDICSHSVIVKVVDEWRTRRLHAKGPSFWTFAVHLCWFLS